MGSFRMDVENDELQCGGRSPESIGMSLDVKLAFSRVCSLIDTLKNDIGPEAASYQMQRIRSDITKVLKRKKERVFMKENEFHQVNGLNASVVSTTRCKESHNPAEHKDRSSYNIPFNNGNTSVYNNNQETFFTSFSSSFRPVVNKSAKAGNSNGNLPTITESSDDSDDAGSEPQDQESDSGSTYFFLKSWSITKQNDELLLTGIKLDKKGDIIEKDFVSKKVICRKDKDTVKTLDGEFVLQGLLKDPKKVIPVEVKNRFSEEAVFPKFWRKALALWIELDKEKTKPRKRSQSPKKKTSLDKSKSFTNGGSTKMQVTEKEASLITKPNSADKDTNLNQKKQRKGKSPSTKLPKENETLEKVKGKNNQAKRNNKKDVTEDLKSTSNKKTKKVKQDNSEPIPKRNKKNGSNEQEKPESSKKKGGLDDRGPFSELIGDDSLFILPKSSLTPNGLLASIKKNVIKGRYTPPTNMFDNVYGSKSDNNTSVNTSFDDFRVKNNHVLKRMCKANAEAKVRKNNKSPKRIIEEDEAINEILRAAKAKTNTTPPIMKEVFSAERAEDSVNFSDLSDIEVE